MKPLILVIFAFLLSSCNSSFTSSDTVYHVKPKLSTNQVQNWGLMVGTWYASQSVNEGGVRQVVSERYSDGTYKIRFKFTGSGGEVEELTEVGQWGVSGRIYFSIYRGVLKNNGVRYSDPSDPYNYDAYEIIELNKSKFVYKSVTSGSVFTAVRVADDFIIPELN